MELQEQIRRRHSGTSIGVRKPTVSRSNPLICRRLALPGAVSLYEKNALDAVSLCFRINVIYKRYCSLIYDRDCLQAALS